MPSFSILNVRIVLVAGTSIYCLDESLWDVMIGLNSQNVTYWLWQRVAANSYLPKLLSLASRISNCKGLMEQGNKGFQLLMPLVLLPNYHSFILP